VSSSLEKQEEGGKKGRAKRKEKRRNIEKRKARLTSCTSRQMATEKLLYCDSLLPGGVWDRSGRLERSPKAQLPCPRPWNDFRQHRALRTHRFIITMRRKSRRTQITIIRKEKYIYLVNALTVGLSEPCPGIYSFRTNQ